MVDHTQGRLVLAQNSTRFSKKGNVDTLQIISQNRSRRNLVKFISCEHSHPDTQATQIQQRERITVAKILNKILANQIQEHIKKISSIWLHPGDAGIVQHVKISHCSPPDEQTEKKHMIISLDDEKAFDKIQYPS